MRGSSECPQDLSSFVCSVAGGEGRTARFRHFGRRRALCRFAKNCLFVLNVVCQLLSKPAVDAMHEKWDASIRNLPFETVKISSHDAVLSSTSTGERPAFLTPVVLRVWIITINGAEGTIYAGEKFRLRVAFPEDYPTKPPAVYFLQSPPPPKHQVGQPSSFTIFTVIVAVHRLTYAAAVLKRNAASCLSRVFHLFFWALSTTLRA